MVVSGRAAVKTKDVVVVSAAGAGVRHGVSRVQVEPAPVSLSALTTSALLWSYPAQASAYVATSECWDRLRTVHWRDGTPV
jgi:hypothetical protein